MPRECELVTSVPVPSRSSITHLYQSMHLADAFAIRLPAGTSADADVLVRFILSHQPAWIGWLMTVRDTIVACFGLKTARYLASLADRVGVFKVYSTHRTEIVLGEDDKHLDFRISLLCADEAEPDGSRQLVFSTVVHCHNRLGRAYIMVIAPFHRLVVKASLVRAARVGWPLANRP
ncbi:MULTISPECIES: DUF2867 domain-containing protein [unclassified Pseudomonas]|uniref:DUF2867 domain-containing protein n=1 Tax=unclassified Pseudomonas TaxID=196821 RepID=UPI000F570F1D|nr:MULTISPECIES: DUF2867 domain-containing protein [unclassified Pseudomonas]AZF21433.1 hypothetical protein C4J91_2683 [Pseudomonas sp. R3-52-08]AZF26766.1 hypothetical protein C4J90_2593 [Pseudomonas sp. R2-60-08W]AZF32117.1 hypothetical protein C4J89_2642 [Pseudomonas sp. R4-35-07]